MVAAKIDSRHVTHDAGCGTCTAPDEVMPMAHRRKRDQRKTRSSPGRARRVVAWLSAGTCVAVFVVLLVSQIVPTPPSDTHGHPPPPHSGQVVTFKAGATHYHVEFVVDPTGRVRVYPLDESATKPLPVEAQPLVLSVEGSAAGEPIPVMLRPVTDSGAAGKTTQFIGRLPASAICGRLTVRFTEFSVSGERYRFEFVWDSPVGEEAFRAAYRDEQRRVFLSPGGKYSEADIRDNGGMSADEKYMTSAPTHDHAPKPGDRTCPVSGFKSDQSVAWVVGGERYAFCCQPCIDEFVLLAKEKPDDVRPAVGYVR